MCSVFLGDGEPVNIRIGSGDDLSIGIKVLEEVGKRSNELT